MDVLDAVISLIEYSIRWLEKRNGENGKAHKASSSPSARVAAVGGEPVVGGLQFEERELVSPVFVLSAFRSMSQHLVT